MAIIFRKLSYTFVFLIYVLIIVTSGYVLYGYYNYQIKMMKIQYEKDGQRQTLELRNRLQKAWHDEMQRTINYGKRILTESQGNFSKGLSIVEDTRKDVERAFYIDAQMIYLAQWKKFRRRQTIERFNLGNTDHPDFKLAEIMEYQDLYYAGAIELYERFWLQNPDNFNAANALARCLFKEGNYERSLKIYRQIYRQNPISQDNEEVPMAITAAFQILNIHQTQSNSHAARAFGLALYQDVLNEKWDLSEGKQYLFVEKVKGELKAFTRESKFARVYQRLEQQERMIEANKKVVRFISRKVIPFIEGSYDEDYYIYFMHHTKLVEQFLLIVPYQRGYLVQEINFMKYLQEHFLPTIAVIEQEHIGITLRQGNEIIKAANVMLTLVANFKLSKYFPELQFDIYFENPVRKQYEEQRQKTKYAFLLGAILFWLVLTSFFWVLYKQVHLAEIKSDIVAHVSHELKTPLTSLRAFSEIIQDEPKLPRSKVRQYCAFMQDETMRLARLIENLLDVTRLEKRKLQYSFTNTKLDSVVKRAVSIYKKNVVGQGRPVRIQVPKKVWLQMDPDAMIRVLMNLLDNAGKYSHNGKPVQIKARAEGKFVRLDIVDHGVGMTQTEIKKVFDKFYQAKRTYEEQYKGVGLGMAIVKHVMQAHKGRIKIKSRINQGTTVSLYLPRKNSVAETP